ncbi:MAG: ferrochelatase, partial [Bacillota bacterium]|nr:ferrochelatase [Bacillota bacterium]
MNAPLGVLLMAYGTPDELSDVEAYFTDIRGGRPPSARAVAELQERYRRIGGRSPLKEITWRQAQALEVELNHPPALSEPVKVYVGMKHWHPGIEEALATMARDGVEEGVALILAPQASRLSSATYMEKVSASRAKVAPHLKLYPVESWHLEPGFIRALVRRIQELARPSSTPLVVTAHSLPERLRT